VGECKVLTIQDLEKLLESKYAELDAIPTDESPREVEETSNKPDFTNDDE